MSLILLLLVLLIPLVSVASFQTIGHYRHRQCNNNRIRRNNCMNQQPRRLPVVIFAEAERNQPNYNYINGDNNNNDNDFMFNNNQGFYGDDDDDDDSRLGPPFEPQSVQRLRRQPPPITANTPQRELTIQPLLVVPPLMRPNLQQPPNRRGRYSDFDSYSNDEHIRDEYYYNDVDESGEYVYNDNDEEDDDDAISLDTAGNFWMNPAIGEPQKERRRDLSGQYRRRPNQPSGTTLDTENNNNRNERRRRRSTSMSSIGNTQPPPPSPMLDLYQRLFWYGLNDNDSATIDTNNDDDDDDMIGNNNNRRSTSSVPSPTMFGGTKGKFNGLSFLNDSIGRVPFNEQRPKRRVPSATIRRSRNSSSQRNDDDMDDDYNDNRNNDNYNYYDDDDNGATYYTQKSPFGTTNYIPVTPPYDPPQVPHRRRSSSSSTQQQQDSSRRRNSRTSNQRIKNTNSNDWVIRTVESWFTPPATNTVDNDDDNYTSNDGRYSDDGSPTTTRSYRQRQQQQRPNLNINDGSRNDFYDNDYDSELVAGRMMQPITNMLDTFLGFDRDMRQGDASPASATKASTSTTLRSQRRRGTYRDEVPQRNDMDDTDRFNKPKRMQREDFMQNLEPDQPQYDVDIEQQQKEDDGESFVTKTVVDESSVDDTSSVLIDVQPEVKNGPNFDGTNDDTIVGLDESFRTDDTVKPLSWEERVAAIERVPPAGVPAWGVDGIIKDNCDARTKAFHDAIIDVQEIKERINVHQQQIVSLKDEISIIHMDIELNKRELYKLKQLHQGREVGQRRGESISISLKKLIEQIRRMENDINKISYEVRYKELQKRQMIFEYNVIVQRRHWAIFHTMKHIVTDETILSVPIDEALNELEMNESAVRHSKSKTKEPQA